jgi:hypothetical protein
MSSILFSRPVPHRPLPEFLVNLSILVLESTHPVTFHGLQLPVDLVMSTDIFLFFSKSFSLLYYLLGVK